MERRTGIAVQSAPQGDPIVVYDWLADRFILTQFAFAAVNGAVLPVHRRVEDQRSGRRRLVAVRGAHGPGRTRLPPVGDINDYSKFGLWHDCLYMAATRSRRQRLRRRRVRLVQPGRPLQRRAADLLDRLSAAVDQCFQLIPSNNQGKGANAVQPGTPNYFVSESGVVAEFEVRKFTPGANCGAGGTLSAPTIVSQAQYTFQQGAIVPQPNTSSKLDMIDDRLMQKVQYRKIGGTESLWVTHPVGTQLG